MRFPFRRCWYVDGTIVPHHLLLEFTSIPFLGESFRVPLKYEDVLVAMYGSGWRIEKKNAPAALSVNLFHPYRSALMLLWKILPKHAGTRIKRLIGRA